ncbi:hypothetical protein RRG08_006122, partial [Elysia crispata]
RGVKAALSPFGIYIYRVHQSVYLMASLRLMAWGLFIIWMLIGLAGIYYFYARNPSWLPCSRAKSRNQERSGSAGGGGTPGDMSTSNPEASSMRVHFSDRFTCGWENTKTIGKERGKNREGARVSEVVFHSLRLENLLIYHVSYLRDSL